MLNENITLTALEDNGEFLFVYSDKYHIFFIHSSYSDLQVSVIITDKYYEVKRIVPIEHGTILFAAESVRWFKPAPNGNKTLFLGRVTEAGRTYHFSFDDVTGSLKLTEQIEPGNDVPVSYGLLSCMGNIEVIHGIQRWGVFYFTGNLTDEDGDTHPVYAEANLSKDKLTRLYFLYSDLGEVVPKSISVDAEESKVHVVGKIDLEEKGVIPYIETFLYRNIPRPC